MCLGLTMETTRRRAVQPVAKLVQFQNPEIGIADMLEGELADYLLAGRGEHRVLIACLIAGVPPFDIVAGAARG